MHVFIHSAKYKYAGILLFALDLPQEYDQNPYFLWASFKYILKWLSASTFFFSIGLVQTDSDNNTCYKYIYFWNDPLKLSARSKYSRKLFFPVIQASNAFFSWCSKNMDKLFTFTWNFWIKDIFPNRCACVDSECLERQDFPMMLSTKIVYQISAWYKAEQAHLLMSY